MFSSFPELSRGFDDDELLLDEVAGARGFRSFV